MSLRILSVITVTALVIGVVYLTSRPASHRPQFEFNKEQPK